MATARQRDCCGGDSHSGSSGGVGDCGGGDDGSDNSNREHDYDDSGGNNDSNSDLGPRRELLPAAGFFSARATVTRSEGADGLPEVAERHAPVVAQHEPLAVGGRCRCWGGRGGRCAGFVCRSSAARQSSGQGQQGCEAVCRVHGVHGLQEVRCVELL